MNKYISFILLFICIATLQVAALQGMNKLHHIEAEEIYKNEVCTLIFSIDESTEIYGFMIDMNYDTTFLQPETNTLQLEKLLSEKNMFLVSNSVKEGRINFVGTLLGKEAMIKGSAKLIQVPLRALKEGNTKLTVNTLTGYNREGEEQEIKFYPQKVVIQRGINTIKKDTNNSSHRSSEKEAVQNQVETVDDFKEDVQDIHNLLASFQDIQGHWAKNSIQALFQKGMISGYEDGTFRPDNFITRTEVATIFAKLLDVQPSSLNSFQDAAEIPAWGKDAVAALHAQGILQGYENECFEPNREMTRAEMIVIAAKLLKEKKKKLNYQDREEIPHWAYSAIQTCSAHAIVKGDDKHYIHPNHFVTRAEAAVIVYNLMEKLNIIK